MRNYSILVILFLLVTSCTNDNNLSETKIKTYIKKGKEIGQATKKYLGTNLMKHMKEGGTLQAIPFCNTAASKLTNEIAAKYNVTIKRTSHKTRAAKNLPNTEELIILQDYLKAIKSKKALKPIVKKDTLEKVHFYAPIKVEGKCLACHGVKGTNINKKTDSILKILYPKDKATGFKVGDLRGILDITFNEQ